MHTKEKKDIDEKTKEYLILLAGCVCKGYWEQQEILEELDEMCSVRVRVPQKDSVG